MALTVNATAVTSHQVLGPNGYEIVGTPTLADGIASAFAQRSYLKTPAFSPGNHPWEIGFEFTTGSTAPLSMGVITGLGSGQNSVAPLYIQTDKRMNFFASSVGGSTWDIANQLNFGVAQENTTYTVKQEFTGSFYNIYLLENDVWVLKNSVQSSTPILGEVPLVIGNNRGNATGFSGLINLNKTYIKIDGKLWFWHPRPTQKIVLNGIEVWRKTP